MLLNKFTLNFLRSLRSRFPSPLPWSRKVVGPSWGIPGLHPSWKRGRRARPTGTLVCPALGPWVVTGREEERSIHSFPVGPPSHCCVDTVPSERRRHRTSVRTNVITKKKTNFNLRRVKSWDPWYLFGFLIYFCCSFYQCLYSYHFTVKVSTLYPGPPRPRTKQKSTGNTEVSAVDWSERLAEEEGETLTDRSRGGGQQTCTSAPKNDRRKDVHDTVHRDKTPCS